MLYIVSPGGTSKVDAGGENFVFGFSRTRENAFLDGFSKNFVFFATNIFCLAEKWRGHGPPGLPGCVGPDNEMKIK